MRRLARSHRVWTHTRRGQRDGGACPKICLFFASGPPLPCWRCARPGVVFLHLVLSFCYSSSFCLLLISLFCRQRQSDADPDWQISQKKIPQTVGPDNAIGFMNENGGQDYKMCHCRRSSTSCGWEGDAYWCEHRHLWGPQHSSARTRSLRNSPDFLPSQIMHGYRRSSNAKRRP
ncbi:hypothetical protein B0H16DRAFT_434540 [Mycena metata]|uniref:Uncharacterized protein n=1 Tax=Mycena metata TaxID=1033252 RepID=A0AAD7HDS8_9AGAR|nr:hypothetical protein B0H16DRAFT_434540 [Mycena metata]